MTDRARIQIDGAIAVVTLTRGDKHNGVDFDMIRALIDAADTLRKNRQVRGVILCGEGPSFCAGLDFKGVFGDRARIAVGLASLWSPVRNDFQKVSLIWRDLAVPVIAAVHGACYGAGMQLALGADLRIATADAKFSLMEAKYGLVPDMGGIAMLRELVRIDVAKELVLTGRVISGTEAHALGLVTYLDADPIARARSILAEMATRSPDAIAAGKFLVNEAWHGSEAEALAAERRWQRALVGRENQRIAMKPDGTPFVQRRLGD